MSKELEALNDLTMVWFLSMGHFEFDFSRIEKALKALEIIKKKNVDVGLLKGLINGNPKTALKDYNHITQEEDLTIEEYDLLKEVLL